MEIKICKLWRLFFVLFVVFENAKPRPFHLQLPTTTPHPLPWKQKNISEFGRFQSEQREEKSEKPPPRLPDHPDETIKPSFWRP